MYCLVSSMNRFFLPTLFFLAGLVLRAQTAETSITISTNPAGPNFSVDGQVYNQAANFVWPAGSKHIVVFLTDTVLPGQTPTQCQTSPQRDTVYCLTSWEDNRNLTQPFTSPIQTVTADPSVTSFTATLTVAYRFQLNFYAAPGPNTPPTCGAPSAIPPGVFRPGV